jgi:integrase
MLQLNYSIDLQAIYLQQSTWVDNMVDKSYASYLYQKRGVYYFSKQVPCDVKQHYSRDRIVICLRTKSLSKAMRSCKSILQRLEDYWMSLRLSAMPLPGQHLIQDRPRDYYGSDTPLLSEALAKYLMLKGEGKDKTFVRGANRNIQCVTDQLGDRPIDAYTSADAAELRDKLIENGLSVSSVKRNFSTIRSIINLTITEQGLDCINAFARTYMPDDDRQRRLPIPIDCIKSIQADCHDADDDMRWLVALLSDTGMRLGEAVGLSVEDVHLNDETPYINITPHPWRRLKTRGSEKMCSIGWRSPVGGF